MFAIPHEFPFPFSFPQNSLGGRGGQSLQSGFSRPKTRNGTGGPKQNGGGDSQKQAEAWETALLVSAQNMGIPAHSSSVPVSAVGAAVAQQSLILPSVKHDSEAEVGEKRLAPDRAQELPNPSVGVLPLHMIEEETADEDGDHAEETPSSPPCSGQQLSAEQYGMNTPAKAARGAC